jgi:hypothetical protein
MRPVDNSPTRCTITRSAPGPRALHDRHLAACLFALVTVMDTPSLAQGGSGITLAWDSSTDSRVSGYVVYVGQAPGALTDSHDAGLVTRWALSGATPGQHYCFAVAAYVPGPLVGPPSEAVCGYSDEPPHLVNPGHRTSRVHEYTTLELQGWDPDGRAVSYSASNLPAGLELTPSTGLIAGTPTRTGDYAVTASVSDGVLSTSQSFVWTITSDAGADTIPPELVILSPESGSRVSTDSIVLAGTARDNVGVERVWWSNHRGSSGTATGTTSWTATVPLIPGRSAIEVTAADATGNETTRTIMVWR